MTAKTGPLDDGALVECLWRERAEQPLDGFDVIVLGTLSDERYFVFHSGTGRWSAFDQREDALVVARLVTRGWVQVDVPHPLPTISLVSQAV